MMSKGLLKSRACSVKWKRAGPRSLRNIAANERGGNIAQFPAVGRVAEQQLSEMDAVRDLSWTLLDRIGHGDWDDMLALQAERDRALRACLKPPIEGEYAEATKAKIQELLRQNEAILEQVNAAKVRLLDEDARISTESPSGIGLLNQRSVARLAGAPF